MTRFTITERVGAGSSQAAQPCACLIETKAATVGASATGPLYNLTRLLGGTSTFALMAGTHANLKLDAATGVISATTGIGAGVSQKALIRETRGELALEYPVTLTGAPNAPGTIPATAILFSDGTPWRWADNAISEWTQ